MEGTTISPEQRRKNYDYYVQTGQLRIRPGDQNHPPCYIFQQPRPTNKPYEQKTPEERGIDERTYGDLKDSLGIPREYRLYKDYNGYRYNNCGIEQEPIIIPADVLLQGLKSK